MSTTNCRLMLPDYTAQRVLRQDVNAASIVAAETIWPYTAKSMKHAALLPQIMPHRQLIFEIFSEAGGRMLLQKPFEIQVQDFLQDMKSGVVARLVPVSMCMLRIMMRHLWHIKKTSNRLPVQFSSLSGILELIDVQPAPRTEPDDSRFHLPARRAGLVQTPPPRGRLGGVPLLLKLT